jgi:hypothetical protein
MRGNSRRGAHCNSMWGARGDSVRGPPSNSMCGPHGDSMRGAHSNLICGPRRNLMRGAHGDFMRGDFMRGDSMRGPRCDSMRGPRSNSMCGPRSNSMCRARSHSMRGDFTRGPHRHSMRGPPAKSTRYARISLWKTRRLITSATHTFFEFWLKILNLRMIASLTPFPNSQSVLWNPTGTHVRGSQFVWGIDCRFYFPWEPNPDFTTQILRNALRSWDA